MKKKTKDLVIIIPLGVIAIIIGVAVLLSVIDEKVEEFSTCQEGWFKYESEAGILCSKIEMTQDEINDYFD